MSEARERETHNCVEHLIFSERVEAKPSFVPHDVMICTRCGATYWLAATALSERPPARAALAAGDRPARAGEADEAQRAFEWERTVTHLAREAYDEIERVTIDSDRKRHASDGIRAFKRLLLALRAGPAGAGAEAGEATKIAEIEQRWATFASGRIFVGGISDALRDMRWLCKALRSAGARPAGDYGTAQPENGDHPPYLARNYETGEPCANCGHLWVYHSGDRSGPCTVPSCCGCEGFESGAAPAPSGPHDSPLPPQE